MITKDYGTNSSKTYNKFTLQCDTCNSDNTSIVPTHHYSNGNYKVPAKITLTLRCLTCGEEHTCSIG